MEAHFSAPFGGLKPAATQNRAQALRLSGALTQWNALLKNEVPALDEAARKENLR